MAALKLPKAMVNFWACKLRDFINETTRPGYRGVWVYILTGIYTVFPPKAEKISGRVYILTGIYTVFRRWRHSSVETLLFCVVLLAAGGKNVWTGIYDWQSEDGRTYRDYPTNLESKKWIFQDFVKSLYLCEFLELEAHILCATN